MPQYVGPRPWDGQVFVGPGHPWFFGWFIPLLFLAVLTGLVVWAVLRMSHRPAAPAVAAGWPPPGARFGPDPALEQARMRYARGELSREEYVQVSRDLGDRSAPSPPPAEPAPPESEPD